VFELADRNKFVGAIDEVVYTIAPKGAIFMTVREDYYLIKNHGIYGCVNENNEMMYIGSTELPLSELEYNHRNWSQKKYKGTDFRLAIAHKGQGWKFLWLQKPQPCTKVKIEIEEGAWIRSFVPKYNKDMDPHGTSVKYGRCDPV